MKRTNFLVIAMVATLFASLSGVSTVFSQDAEINLIIDGAVQHTLALTLDDLAAMPRSMVQAELHCYNEFVTSGEWGGVQLGYLLEQAGVDHIEAGAINFKASDGYEINDFSLSDAFRSDVIIAYEKDGVQLSEGLRLVVPGVNGNVWISLLTHITVKDSPGLSLEALTPMLPPKFTDPELQSNSSISEPVQSSSQPLQDSADSPFTESQSLQNQTTTDTQSNSSSTKEEPAGLPPQISYVYVVIGALGVAGMAAFYLHKRENRNRKSLRN